MLKQCVLRPSGCLTAPKPGKPTFTSLVRDAGIIIMRYPGYPQSLLATSLIHSRASMTPLNQRAKQLMRPIDTFRAPCRSEFVMSPTKVGETPGRTTETSAARKRLQLSKSSRQLLRCLKKEIACRRLDASVFGAAYQRCGQGRWWHALLEVRRLQKECCINLYPIEVCIFLKSLRLCIRGESGFGAVDGREKLVVKLGKEAWDEHPIQSIQPASAALDLCAAADRSSGLPWAEELMSWAASQGFQKDSAWYNAIAHVRAVHGHPQQVIDLLSEAGPPWQPGRLTLGTLVNDFAERRDWQTAERIWKLMVDTFGVLPCEIQYGALCKAHLLCGRPSAAAEAIANFTARGEITGPPVAKAYVQCLLVVYHSSLDREVSARLQKAIRRGEILMERASEHSRTEWDTLKRVCRRIESKPASVSLKDVLVTWNAQRSAMAEWQDYPSGSRYLADHE